MQRNSNGQSLKELRMEEQELMGLVQDGDEMAFAKIVRIYKNKIVSYLWKLTGDYEKAAELAQETFIRVYFKAKKYRPIAPLSSWIYAIASNLAKTEMKRARRFSAVSLEDVTNKVAEGMAHTENPGDLETVKRLRMAISSLHPRYRIPIVLKDIEGYSQEEIAQILNTPVGTIKARISRGRSYLRQELEKTEKTAAPSTHNERYDHGRA